MKYRQIRWGVFLPPAILFIGCIIWNLCDGAGFSALATAFYDWILNYFGWAFLLTAVVSLGICIWIYFSPLGRVRIGGPAAKPKLTNRNWFTVTLGTTIAAGIVFWGAAEPVQHILYPPESTGIAAMTAESARFAMAAIYRHWTVLPYAMYTLLAVMFAYGCYNMKASFSIGSMMAPLIREKGRVRMNGLIDVVCVFSLVTGLSASLGIGTLSINSGLSRLFGLSSNPAVWLAIIVFVGGISIISAISGIKKGITLLSNINVGIYIFILLFILCFGGTLFIVSFGIEGIGEFLDTFFSGALFTGVLEHDPWTKNWTMYYFGNWMAWTPITAVFLGQISYGRTIREVIKMNLLLTALFSVLWFMIISGATVNILFNTPVCGLVEAYQLGYENVIYQLFKNLPMAELMVPVYLAAVLISFVTAADSSTVAITNLCCRQPENETVDSPAYLKIVWGVIIGVVTWIMMGIGDGLTGIKMLSNIGGLAAMFLIIGVIASAVVLIKKTK
ncbi:MAG: BCCT family transporter [Eubacterium sp.]|nr:BCCT family transporter [Eubacterium sp.]